MIAASLVQLVGEYLFTERTRQEEKNVMDIASQIQPLLLSGETDEIYQIARSIEADGSRHILMVDEAGVVQIDLNGMLNGRRLKLREVGEVLNGEPYKSGMYKIESSATKNGAFLSYLYTQGAVNGIYTARLSNQSGKTYGAIVSVAPADDIYDELVTIEKRVYILLTTVALAVSVLSILMMRGFTRPIADLSEGISHMTKGDLSSRINVRGHNEFTELANAFNAMSERLESLDRSRNQFVSNASHELKTPLSTMKILIETLLYQEPLDPVMTKDFLNDANKEIDRLNSIITDLLSIAKIDSGGMKLTLTQLSLSNIVQDSAKRLSPLAREHGIELEVNVKDALETLGDEQKLTQVFYNLIDNAIKYTPRGGYVKVEALRSGKRAIIRVADNGIGIPREDQLHIFDRFYRVDKARSRATGGTGLGLSIVKQIVVMHQGEISVVSAEEVGSTFIVELPIVTQ